jgi:DNA-binding Lrp family transcriptional regulator
MKMSETIEDVVNEECNELKLQLEVKDQQLEAQKIQSEKEKEELKERTIIEQFPENTQCIYIGKVDNKTLGNPNSKMYREILIKFGQSNNLAERVKCHKKTYENFRLYAAYKVKNKIEIENLIKKHPVLKPRIRLITTEDGVSHREILAIDDNNFTIEKVEEYIKEIIKHTEYNLENYNLLLKKVDEQDIELNNLKRELESKQMQMDELNSKLKNYTGEGDITINTMSKIASNYALCKYGYFLYAFQYEEMRFICSITRQKEFESLSRNLTQLYPQGVMKMHCVVSYPFSEKNMMFLLKQHCVALGANKFETSFENIQKILNIATKLETVLTENANDLDKLLSILNGTRVTDEKESTSTQEQEPIKRKSKRSVDQIHKDTGEVINVFESIEAAGRHLGLTTGTAIGISLREKRVCQGFLWRYSGFSKGEQFDEKPIIKVCCSTGEKMYFNTIADAARDVNISPPALRNRVLTDIHCNGHHWIFQK